LFVANIARQMLKSFARMTFSAKKTSSLYVFLFALASNACATESDGFGQSNLVLAQHFST